MNGLLELITEIAARSEQHFCPTKHAHPLLKAHSRDTTFLPYGDAKSYKAQSDAVAHAYKDLAARAKLSAKLWDELMTKSELDAFRRKLKRQLAESDDVRSSRQDLAVETSADELDRTQQAQARDFAVGALNRESERARQLRGALRRMDAGTFGLCVSCDEAINAKRLAAVPWASRCIICQNAVELVGSTEIGESEATLALTE
jgi:DnaK suppressor protein